MTDKETETIFGIEEQIKIGFIEDVMIITFGDSHQEFLTERPLEWIRSLKRVMARYADSSLFTTPNFNGEVRAISGIVVAFWGKRADYLVEISNHEAEDMFHLLERLPEAPQLSGEDQELYNQLLLLKKRFVVRAVTARDEKVRDLALISTGLVIQTIEHFLAAEKINSTFASK